MGERLNHSALSIVVQPTWHLPIAEAVYLQEILGGTGKNGRNI